MKFASTYAATLVMFALTDLVWLGLIAKNFYRSQLGSLMADPIHPWPAIAFYLLFPIGLVIFAVRPSTVTMGMADAALLGAMFGFFAYATYDLTNLATLKNWPLALTFVDLAWGTVLSGLASAAGRLVVERF